MSISRRSVVIGLGAGTFVTGSSGAAQLLRPTPQETFGPFFPLHTPPHQGSDLTRMPGRPGRATGQIIEISGQVLRVDGSPVKRATMEVWQANAAGRQAQMYFPGEALNEKDILLSTMPARHRDPALTLCRPIEPHEPGVLRFGWDIVMLQA
jgi:protocatechuate 3,4-dioxygenase beta subunit